MVDILHIAVTKGAYIYYVRKAIGVGWCSGSVDGNFPLIYLIKMPLRREVGGSKEPQNNLT